MRSPSIASAFYAPAEPPEDQAAMRYYIKDELLKVGAVLQLLAAGHVDKVNAPPSKPREGDIRLADGTQWNPGSGAGVYAYYGGTWKFLG